MKLTDMTARDYMAAAALPGVLASAMPTASTEKQMAELPEVSAKFSYLIADAMMKAREEGM